MDRIAIARLMGAISKNVEAQFKNKLSDIDFNFDLNYSYFQYLIIISAYNGINQNELAKRMNVGKGSVSKAVKYLLQSDLINRKQDEADSRVKNVYLTKKGKKIADRFKVVFIELNSKLVKGFSKSEVSELRNMLEKIYKNTTDENNYILDALKFQNE
ncbi:MAG: MarR family transcriptional regulator [Clostridia bacterium]|nr:MarR family transcriptional regulator [Clostridia bacterium]